MSSTKLNEDAPVPGLSVLVPVYNERSTIGAVLEKIRSVAFPVRTEIVVVDDGSTDGTAEMLRRMPFRENTRVLFHERNQGKGRAVRTALQAARGEIVVVQDADEELDPGDLLRLYRVVAREKTAVCYGSRFAGETRRFRWQPVYWANRLLNGMCNAFNGLHLTDMNTCYKMMPAEVAKRLDLVSPGFAMEPEITTKLARMGITIIEEPVSYRPRAASQGKKVRAFDLFRYVVAMVKFRWAGSPTRLP